MNHTSDFIYSSQILFFLHLSHNRQHRIVRLKEMSFECSINEDFITANAFRSTLFSTGQIVKSCNRLIRSQIYYE